MVFITKCCFLLFDWFQKLGDGAGVGKGRTVAGVIFENFQIGRKKAIWISVSNDLQVDALRDLNDIGANEISVHSLKEVNNVKIHLV